MFASLTRLQRYYLYYTVGFLAFIGALAVLERHGMPPRWIGYAFLCFTISMYALIGIVCRTADVSEYYVAGRRVPAFFNGMATGADWMSAASFIGLAGTLYLSGFQGLAYVIGWTSGFVLVALLLAPYLGRFGQYTIPDFLGARYGGNAIRLVAVAAAILASFVYVVAQIYGVGVITSRFVRRAVRAGDFRRPRRHSRVFIFGGHAGRDLDAGSTVPDPDRCLHHPGRHPLLQSDWQPGAATGLRSGAAAGHRA